MISRITEVHGLEGKRVRSVNGTNGRVNVTPALIGAPPAAHSHPEGDINGMATIMTNIRNAVAAGYTSQRAVSVLKEGLNVVHANSEGVADLEIEGRTLTSLANSNLEAGKYYILADKKTKVIADGVTRSGVSKFQKGTTTVTTTDFSGKVSGSTVANPHFIRYKDGLTQLLTPSEVDIREHTNNGYSFASSINGIFLTRTETVSGFYAQNLFSFNIVEQIEKTLGLIPRSTLAEKVQWVKDNINAISIIWYGFGSSVSGNKAILSRWIPATSTWQENRNHTSSSVTALSSGGSSSYGAYIDDSGFSHYLVNADPSDGVTASIINTDYITATFELKATAQLNTRGRIIRVENFEGKVSGSTLENPHKAKYNAWSNLLHPDTASNESVTGIAWNGYGNMSSLNNSYAGYGPVGSGFNGYFTQQFFSFDVIAAVERNIGKIPGVANSEKVSWLKENIQSFGLKWYGFGQGPLGNKATLAIWNPVNSTWAGAISHSFNTVSFLSKNQNTILYPYDKNYIDASGNLHYIAYGDPSDGVTASTINTDYVELELELKADANFTAPRVPLYEVDSATYANVLGAWDEAEVLRRYPVVEGMQHVTNPYILAEGDNLSIPLSEITFTGNGTSIVNGIGTNDITLSGNQYYGESTSMKLPLIIGQAYTFSIDQEILEGGDAFATILFYNSGAFISERNTFTSGSGRLTMTFTVPANCNEIRLRFARSISQRPFVVRIYNLMIALGSVDKKFTPRNPSYLYTETKLGAIGDKKDLLFRQDGQWKRRKLLEKVELDGSQAWTFGANHGLHKRFNAPFTNQVAGLYPPTSKFDGSRLKSNSTVDLASDISYFTNILLAVTASNFDTGFAEAYTPTTNDIKRYFNGWKYSDGITWTSVTGNGQTATAQQALDTKPTDYTPYKLSYVLATPVIENVNVEGELKVSGSTQLEIGTSAIFREKVITPSSGGGFFFIGVSTPPIHSLKYKATKILAVYKNGQLDNKWTNLKDSNKVEYCRILTADYDATAEYTVSYIPMDILKLSTNILDTKLYYPQDFKTSFQSFIGSAENLATRASVNHKAILDAYIELEAMKGGG